MISPFRAAALQFPIDMGAVERNARRAFALLREASKREAALCVLPEMWSTGFSYDNLRALCGTTPGLLRDLCRFAADRRVVIVGSLPERSGRAVYNTLYVIDSTGAITGEYRKTHLFSPSGEHLHFRRGTAASVAHTSVGTIGPQICYDLRFPELSRKYYLEGATLFCVSAQWPAVRKAHWDLLTVARAVENQLFVVASNAVGRSGEFRYSGGSAILSPWGERLAQGGKEEGLVIAKIDPAGVDEARRRIPCAKDRNERAYRKTRRKR
ncbi:MAG TPA: carbon-nitrogen family hydrolase [Candidatus Deferrimicrobiaceae bacterium]|nr:carbon-nitrogen family hydrolase [Candidatus Deferrimicrobiaceae bacterium]